MVHDQKGSPTYTRDLADWALALGASGVRGLFHLANAGQASWFELASKAICLAGLPCRVRPSLSAAWSTKAVRPPFSVLDTEFFSQATGITPRPWRQALRDYLLWDLKLGNRRS